MPHLPNRRAGGLQAKEQELARDRKLRLERITATAPEPPRERPPGKLRARLEPKDQQGVLWQRGPDAL
jgi:hypothetical protein